QRELRDTANPSRRGAPAERRNEEAADAEDEARHHALEHEPAADVVQPHAFARRAESGEDGAHYSHRERADDPHEAGRHVALAEPAEREPDNDGEQREPEDLREGPLLEPRAQRGPDWSHQADRHL